MKTPGFILIVVLLVSASATAQTRLNLKTDTLIVANDTILSKLQNELKLKNPFGNESYSFVPRGNRPFQMNPNLAVIPNQRPRVYADPSFRMPILKPSFHSNMPVMKPDSSIHYHLKIKKYDGYITK